MSFYVSGTALGGFMGRVGTGILTDRFNWRIAFLALGAASLAGAAAVAAWLPRGIRVLPVSPLRPANQPSSSSESSLRKQLRVPPVSPLRPGNQPSSSSEPSLRNQLWVPPVSPLRPGNQASSSSQLSFPYQMQALFRRRRLIATFAVGFNVLFSLVGVFTWITFHLSAAPYSLSTTALSSLFFVYLVGLIVTPAAGFLITRVGLRAGIAGAIACSMAGVLLTLAPSLWIIILGLALVSSGVFIAQTAAQSHLRVAAPSGARVTAAGLYMTCYYLGGTAAGVVPGAFWAIGKWPACAAFIVAMQALALAIALAGWRTSEIHPNFLPQETMNPPPAKPNL